jgi:hypothetical protein
MHDYAYNGWSSFLPPTVSERAPQLRVAPHSGQDRTYLEGMPLPASTLLAGSLEYWRVY